MGNVIISGAANGFMLMLSDMILGTRFGGATRVISGTLSYVIADMASEGKNGNMFPGLDELSNFGNMKKGENYKATKLKGVGYGIGLIELVVLGSLNGVVADNLQQSLGPMAISNPFGVFTVGVGAFFTTELAGRIIASFQTKVL